MSNFPIRIQMTSGENGATALFMMLGYFNKYVPMDQLRETCVSSRNGTSPAQLKEAAESYDLQCELKELSFEELLKQKTPVVVKWKKRYFVIVTKVDKETISVIDPAKGKYKAPYNSFRKNYGGMMLTFAKGPNFVADGKKESMYSLIKDRVKPIMKPIIAMIILTLICISTDLALSRGMKFMMDDIVTDSGFIRELIEQNMLPSNQAQGLSIITSGFMFIMYFGTLFQMFFQIKKNRVVNQTSRRQMALSNSGMIKKMMNLPLRFFEQYSVGELMGRLDSNEKLEDSIMNSLIPRMINTFMTIFYFFMIFSYDKTIALVSLTIEAVYFAITLKLQEQNAILSRANATSSNSLNSSVLNGMNMIETIRSTGSEKDFFSMWYESLMQANESRMDSMRINRVMSMVDGVHSFLLRAVQLFLGAYFIGQGRLTLGTMTMFQNVFGNMRSSLSSALSSMNAMQTMRTNIERVNDIMNRETPKEIPLEEGVEYEKLRGNISVNNVCYRYNNGDDLALDNVSLEIKQGQMIALVGGTGCGKSTLLKVIADLYKAESGEIYYDGKKREENRTQHGNCDEVGSTGIKAAVSLMGLLKLLHEGRTGPEIHLAKVTECHELVDAQVILAMCIVTGNHVIPIQGKQFVCPFEVFSTAFCTFLERQARQLGNFAVFKSLVHVGKTAKVAHQLEMPPCTEEIHLTEQQVALIVRTYHRIDIFQT